MDPDPEPAFFAIDLQDPNKKLIFLEKFFLLISRYFMHLSVRSSNGAVDRILDYFASSPELHFRSANPCLPHQDLLPLVPCLVIVKKKILTWSSVTVKICAHCTIHLADFPVPF